MVVLDAAIVNVALPAMRTDLSLSLGQQQWVVNAYLIAFGGLLLLAARAGDLVGRRLLFQGGVTLFTFSSLVAGLSTDASVLLGARAVQGVGAAALAPATLSLITSVIHDPHVRSRALALWGAAASGAAAVGVVLGGVLTDALSWRWVFFVNVPVGIVLVVGAGAALLPDHRGGQHGRLDVPGAVTVTLGVAALVYALTQVAEQGWGSTTVLSALGVAGVLLAVFLHLQVRTAEPLVRLDIFRLPGLGTANVVLLCIGATMTGALFFLSLYLQHVSGYSPTRTGLALLPMAAVLCLCTPVVRWFVISGVRGLPVVGGAVSASGFVWLSALPLEPAFLTHVLGATLLVGFGLVMMHLPTVMAGTTGVPVADAGLASGLINVSRQLGGAIGLAVLITIASAVSSPGSVPEPGSAAVLDGYQAAFLACAVISLIAGAAAVGLARRR